MNTTVKIVISILILVCGFLVLFSKIQVNEAEKQMKASMELSEENKDLRIQAENQAKIAEKFAAESIEIKNQEIQIAKELKECKASK